MTDNNRLTDLVERLRRWNNPDCKEAADALEAQGKMIADLRKEADMMHSEYKTAAARIAALEAALMFYQDKDNWKINGPLDANGANFTGGPASDVLEGKDD